MARGMFLPKLLPMIVPPKPWVDYQSGGYLTITTEAMRGATQEAEQYLKEAVLSGSLDRAFGGLDALGRTRWRINDTMLKHIITAWNTGKSIGKIPRSAEESPSTVPKPDNFAECPRTRALWHKEVQDAK